MRGIEKVAEGFTSLSADSPEYFAQMAESILAYQRANNPIYNRYCKSDFTYLPVEAFKLAPLATFPVAEAQRVFESSGTGRSIPSKHYVKDLSVYDRSILSCFERFFGRGPFTFLAHLPQYVEKGQRSSLLYMVDLLIREHGDEVSGFFLDDHSFLERGLAYCEKNKTSLILFGAAFGLLDLLEHRQYTLPKDALVIETGGMKTYRREISRNRLHDEISDGFGVPRHRVRSEYGMCEMLSQCYTTGGELFFPPPWLKTVILDPNNPTKELAEGEEGVLAVLDLANMYSVSAILTEDRAIRRGEGFEILGRLSKAELRGCNFLIESGLSN